MIFETLTTELMETDKFTSDTHFGHQNVIQYCNRPFCCRYSMDEALIRNWNDCVAPTDRVFHLGDFAFMNKGNICRIVSRLNGYIFFIKGNHDYSKKQGLGFGFVHSCNNIETLATHNGQTYKIFMSHKPQENTDKYDLYLCGHVHEKWKHKGKSVNIGVDVWNFRPITMVEILDYYESTQLPVGENHG
jgi:calcineurin-like phosphoesterase family protein